MKRRLKAIGAAIGTCILVLSLFASGYFGIAVTLLWGHGSRHLGHDLVAFTWLALTAVVPLWVAVVCYRYVMREEP